MPIIIYFILSWMMLLAYPILQANVQANKELLYASKFGHPDQIFRLIKTDGADINATDEEGCTPLMLAAQHHKLNSIEQLLDNKPKLDLQDKNGNTALLHALIPGVRITEQQRHIAEMLLEHGANPMVKNNNNQMAIDIVRMKQKDGIAQETESSIRRYMQQNSSDL